MLLKLQLFKGQESAFWLPNFLQQEKQSKELLSLLSESQLFLNWTWIEFKSEMRQKCVNKRPKCEKYGKGVKVTQTLFLEIESKTDFDNEQKLSKLIPYDWFLMKHELYAFGYGQKCWKN